MTSSPDNSVYAGYEEDELFFFEEKEIQFYDVEMDAPAASSRESAVHGGKAFTAWASLAPLQMSAAPPPQATPVKREHRPRTNSHLQAIAEELA